MFPPPELNLVLVLGLQHEVPEEGGYLPERSHDAPIGSCITHVGAFPQSAQDGGQVAGIRLQDEVVCGRDELLDRRCRARVVEMIHPATAEQIDDIRRDQPAPGPPCHGLVELGLTVTSVDRVVSGRDIPLGVPVIDVLVDEEQAAVRGWNEHHVVAALIPAPSAQRQPDPLRRQRGVH